jgi:carbon storage regulator CsrA
MQLRGTDFAIPPPALWIFKEGYFMLVLTRKTGESIVIGNVTVHVGQVLRGRVRIAIDAPPDISIVRAELVHASEHGTEARSEEFAFAGS